MMMTTVMAVAMMLGLPLDRSTKLPETKRTVSLVAPTLMGVLFVSRAARRTQCSDFRRTCPTTR